MTNTYTATLFNHNIIDSVFRLYIHEAVKWEASEDDERKAEYTRVKAWTIVEGGPEAEAIEAETDEAGIDEQHEYLILHFEDGTTATFRNSHVDLFIR